ncbi:MAG: hypothetical protein KJ915_09160 [Candidatus Omnitrophica bacterium]|nr:hypothetical protein [Candidatus Omnitrophota bacterium]
MEIIYTILKDIKNYFTKKRRAKNTQTKSIKKVFYALQEFDTYLNFIRPINSTPSPYPTFLSQEKFTEFSDRCQKLSQTLDQNAFDCPDYIEKNIMIFKKWIVAQEMIVKHDDVSPLNAKAVEDGPFQKFRATLSNLIEYLSKIIENT